MRFITCCLIWSAYAGKKTEGEYNVQEQTEEKEKLDDG